MNILSLISILPRLPSKCVVTLLKDSYMFCMFCFLYQDFQVCSHTSEGFLISQCQNDFRLDVASSWSKSFLTVQPLAWSDYFGSLLQTLLHRCLGVISLDKQPCKLSQGVNIWGLVKKHSWSICKTCLLPCSAALLQEFGGAGTFSQNQSHNAKCWF